MPNTLPEHPLAVIGGEDTVIGFKALGFRTYAVKGLEDAEETLDEIIKGGEGVCLVEEKVYAMTKKKIGEYSGLPLPIFIPFSKKGSLDMLEEIIKDIRLRAIGRF